MRALLQRVSQASVSVDGQTVGSIGTGLAVLLGVGPRDDQTDIDWLVDKISGLRIFSDEAGRMNKSIQEVSGSILIVPQFTLFADTQKGRRPSFIQAAEPAVGEPLYEQFVAAVKETSLTVATGKFGTMMDVQLTNHGPVTIWLDSKDRTGN